MIFPSLGRGVRALRHLMPFGCVKNTDAEMTRRPFPHGCLRTFLHRHRQSMPSNWVLTLSAYERNVLFYARKILFSDFSHTHSHACALAACRFCLICYFWVLPINRCKTLLWIIPFDCLFVEFRTTCAATEEVGSDNTNSFSFPKYLLRLRRAQDSHLCVLFVYTLRPWNYPVQKHSHVWRWSTIQWRISVWPWVTVWR